MIKKAELEIGGRNFVLETGRVARQASGSVIVRYGDTVVLVTAVSSKEIREGIDFLPLLVEYQEMYYAAGRIPGSYFRREIGRPSEKETVTARLIDRPLRPLFPKGYRYDTQIIATVLSVDPEIDPDVLAITGASAALHLSHIPFAGPVAGVRIGRVNGEFVVNPTTSEVRASDLNLVIAGTKEAICMVEGSAREVPEEVVLEALFLAHEEIKRLVAVQEELRAECGQPKMAFEEPQTDEALKKRLLDLFEADLREVITTPVKVERGRRRQELELKVLEQLGEEVSGREKEVLSLLKEIEKEMMRAMIAREKRRIDGRAFDEVRPISCEVGLLPRTHGSALFTRGETQVLVIVTLGSTQDEQRIEAPGGEVFKHFMLHYNFPPYCVGEVRPLRGPSRRDIGHGLLAERALLAVVPDQEEFPYTIRVVSEVLESNGSSSMATVCGGTLSLMDAGVPIKDMVAGVAMGLIKEDNQFYTLTDILGDEDHLGDMDFKVAGTDKGITALQMDIKITGVTREILSQALDQAREARRFILSKMREVISKPREALSAYAPRLTTIQISPNKIRDLIGPGGKTIKGIIAACEDVKIEVEDSGLVRIFAPNTEAAEKAIKMIREVTQEAEVGKLYLGRVTRITDFGAFVEIFPGTTGLIHISQMDKGRVRSVSDILKEGDEVLVKVIDIDRQGRIKLSRRAALEESMRRLREEKDEDSVDIT
ncbi:polyribonucleotide nucleotidyltransferase [Thermosulfuriphilus ammonigenes]|uniref:Polyribonucleotide nucleotidyltransferase n=1 Tax=Thermosulfuriphilus ammonigenes TaxID=1936021 RepID=A0A6G7PV93_9BACT|nr:polyribonucleotide nucleotidyltransferase [Thermosulfuriphilus ammonigenes]MBA2848235.1 polyribonucleotide nucleotidyltransferase [Thermosulfuriphilus ammonigenes]QIJ71599.1 polyribonucleotide nucleotidyltransferase [Thermosulfuriphilus ammonigenes]